jgi:hypothetical protein
VDCGLPDARHFVGSPSFNKTMLVLHLALSVSGLLDGKMKENSERKAPGGLRIEELRVSVGKTEC